MNGRRAMWLPRTIVAPDADWDTYITHAVSDPDTIWSRRRCTDCCTVGGRRLQAAPCPGDPL